MLGALHSARGRESFITGCAHHFLTRIAVERTAVPRMTAARIPIMVNVAELMTRVRITSRTGLGRDHQITHLLQMLCSDYCCRDCRNQLPVIRLMVTKVMLVLTRP